MKKITSKQVVSLLISFVIIFCECFSGFISFDSYADSLVGTIIEEYTLDNGIKCTLYDSGYMTIVGSGAIPDYNVSTTFTPPKTIESTTDTPWENYREHIKKVDISSGITRIGNNAFFECKNLTEVKFPATLKSIGDAAFSSCSNLSSIDFPNGLNIIGEYAFAACDGLAEVTIPDSVIDIGERTFNVCKNIESVKIGKGIKKISDAMFYSCSSLKLISIPENVTSIGYNAFTNCSSLEEVVIHKYVNDIYGEAFSYCTGLKKVTFYNPNVYIYPMMNNPLYSGNYEVFKGCSDTIKIYGFDESTAQKMCDRNGMIFISMGEAPEILPTTVPTGAAEPTTVPTGAAEPTTVPTGAAEPTTVPTGAAEPTTVPTGAAEPTTVPTGAVEPTLVPTEKPTITPVVINPEDIAHENIPTPEPTPIIEPVADITIDPINVNFNFQNTIAFDCYNLAAVSEIGDLYCWGADFNKNPDVVLQNVKSTAAGNDFVAAVTNNGDLYLYGYRITKTYSPVKVDDNVRYVIAEEDDLYYIKENNDLHYMYLVSGNGYKVNSAKLRNVDKIFNFRNNAAAITTNGDLYCWGNNEYGQVGNGTKSKVYDPYFVMSNVISADINDENAAAVTKDGKLYTWGRNLRGQIGDGTTSSVLTPKYIIGGMKDVHLGDETTYAISAAGALWGWGDNPYCELGKKTEGNVLQPMHIIDNVYKVCASYDNLYFLLKDGSLYCTGSNRYGQLGNGEAVTEKPYKAMEKVVDFVIGGYRNYVGILALNSDGQLYGWGQMTLTTMYNKPQLLLQEVAKPAGALKISTAPKDRMIPSKDLWSFKNSDVTSVLSSNTPAGIPQNLYEKMFSPEEADEKRAEDDGTKGVSFGMAYGAYLFKKKYFQPKDFGAQKVSDIRLNMSSEDISYSLEGKPVTISDIISMVNLYQLTDTYKDEYDKNKVRSLSDPYVVYEDIEKDRLKKLYENVKNEINQNAGCVLHIKSEDYTASLLVVDYTNSANEMLLYVYDPDLKAVSKLHIYKNGISFSDWNYQYDDNDVAKSVGFASAELSYTILSADIYHWLENNGLVSLKNPYSQTQDVTNVSSGEFDYEILEDGNIKINNYYGNEKNLVIPSTINGRTVTTLKAGMIYDNKYIESVYIPKTINKVDEKITMTFFMGAICGCKNLKKVEFEEGITEIPNYICSDFAVFPNGIYNFIEEIKIPESVKKIGLGAFEGCQSLEKIEIPYNLEELDSWAFRGDISLKQVVLPESLGKINREAFSECENLEKLVFYSKDVVFEDNYIMEKTPNIVFYGYTNSTAEAYATLKDIPFVSLGNAGSNMYNGFEYKIVDNSYVSIVNYKGISTSISIPNSIKGFPVERLEAGVFKDNQFVEAVTVPSTVTKSGLSGGYGALGASPKLKEVTFEEGTTSIPSNICYNGEIVNHINSVVLPDSLYSIGDGAFRGCDKLPSIILQDKVVSFGNSIFDGCSDDFIIYGYKYSKAEEYASKYGITFIPLTDVKSIKQYIFRARYLKDTNKLPVSSWENNIDKNTCCGMLAESLDSGNFRMKDLSTIWSGVQKVGNVVQNPAQGIPEYMYEEQEMYEGMIFAIFAAEAKGFSLDISVYKDTRSMLDFIADNVDAGLEIKIENHEIKTNREWFELSEANKKKTIEGVKKCVVQDVGFFKTVDGYAKLSKFIGNTFKVYGTFDSALKRIATYEELMNMTDSYKNILIKMGQLCPAENKNMKNAFIHSAQMMNNTESVIDKACIETVGVDSFNYLSGFIWDKLIKNIIGGKAYVVYSAWTAAFNFSSALTNSYFNSGNLAADYFKLRAFHEIYGVALRAYNYYKNNYKGDNNYNNAKDLCSMAEIMYSFKKYDVSIANGYIDNYYDSYFTRVLSLFKNTYSFIHGDFTNDKNGIKSFNNSIEQNLDSAYNGVLVDWIYDLEETYPADYEMYKDLLDIGDQTELQNTMRVACPVDVLVYDKEGKLAAKIVQNNAVIYDSSISAGVYEDEKYLFFTKNISNYQIQCVGYDAGSMDIGIEEHSFGKVGRKIQFNGVSLSNGEIFIPETNNTSGKYILKHIGSNDINPTYDSSHIDECEMYTVKVSKGVANWEGTYGEEIKVPKNADVRISAISPIGYKFGSWTVKSGNISAGNRSEESFINRINGDIEVEANYVVDPNYKKDEPSSGQGGGNNNPNNNPNTDNKPSSKPSENINPGNGGSGTQTYAIGTIISTSDKKGVYKIISNKNNVYELQYVRPQKKTYTSISVPATVKVSGRNAKVVSIASNACKKNVKLKSVTIGANVKAIGKNAFNGCKKLKKITIKTKLLNKKSIGKNAFKGIYKKAVFKCPKKKKSSYKKILKKSGAPKKCKYK